MAAATSIARRLLSTDFNQGGDRAELLQFACELPGVTVDPRIRIAAAGAVLAAGRPALAHARAAGAEPGQAEPGDQYERGTDHTTAPCLTGIRRATLLGALDGGPEPL
jgi:hypothetical protein